MDKKYYSDVVVVGGGNAALCAAMAASHGGAAVTVLEAAVEGESGGNSWFTDGAMRFAFSSMQDITSLLNLSASEASKMVIPPYPPAQYRQDLLDSGASHPDLYKILADNSYETMQWLADNGIALELVSDNQAHLIDGKHHFFGNLVVRTVGRGIGMIANQKRRCAELGVPIYYNTRAVKLLQTAAGDVCGVEAVYDGHRLLFQSQSVILACGGFEGNVEMRVAHLGERWRYARTRGTRHNQGDGIQMALATGAAKYGNWAGCHAVGTDSNTPDGGDTRFAGDIWKKHSYPYGLLINQSGRRFVDEGADLRNYTYAKYGKAILSQPDAVAYQLFDAQTAPLLRSEYRHEHVAKFSADTIGELAQQMGVDAQVLQAEITQYNDAVQEGEFNPAILDGKRTRGLTIDKNNWALPLTQPPFLAFAVVCGITFTFGGLAVDSTTAVLHTDDNRINGLYACGEMVGGLFGDNYPGGSGLMSGSVFGRLAGTQAAAKVNKVNPTS